MQALQLLYDFNYPRQNLLFTLKYNLSITQDSGGTLK